MHSRSKLDKRQRPEAGMGSPLKGRNTLNLRQKQGLCEYARDKKSTSSNERKWPTLRRQAVLVNPGQEFILESMPKPYTWPEPCTCKVL
jgi:hypothetical protein